MTGLFFKDTLDSEKYKKERNGAIEISVGFAKDGDTLFLYGPNLFQKLDFFFNSKFWAYLEMGRQFSN